MKTTTFAKVCQDANMKFKQTTKSKVDLSENEFYALMVTTSDRSNPYIIGVEAYTHKYLIGIEKPNRNYGYYISKNFYDRNNNSRGTTVVVEVENPESFTVLNTNKPF